jgi:RimJ/RimL family protein N-acetyltransferase
MMEIPALPPPLPEETLARCRTLTRRLPPITLTGRFVRLEPLDAATHAPALFPVTNGEAISLGGRTVEPYDAEKLIWRYLAAGPFATLDEFTRYCERQQAADDGLAMCVIDLPTGAPIGVATFMSNAPEHLKIELGGIWYSPIAQGTPANTEATYLMLGHAFDLGYRRLEWKCNARNERSRRAALRMGFRFEGIQENHMILKGRSRNTAWFRILDREWPDVARHLQNRLYR